MINERNKILIADDEQAMRDLPEIILGENFPDFKVEKFKDGNSLEKRLVESPSDVKVVLTDNQMGRHSMTGGDIILKYARNPEYKDIKFILCYGGHDMLGEAAKTAGAFAYIKKPFSEGEYVGVVREALEGK